MFHCIYCGKEYKGEKCFNKHFCKEKERYYERNNPEIQMAFNIYEMIHNKKLIRDNFAKSRYYEFCKKIALSLIEWEEKNPYDYVKWCLKLKTDKFSNIETYNEYNRVKYLDESPKEAIERSIIYIDKFNLIGSFFNEKSPNWIIDKLKSGKISLWLILVYPNNETLFNRFDEYYWKEFNKLLTPMWTIKLDKYKDEIKQIKDDLENIIL